MPKRSGGRSHAGSQSQAPSSRTSRQHGSASPLSKVTLQTGQVEDDYKQDAPELFQSALQLLLFNSILLFAYICNPNLDILFLAACGVALVLILALRVWAASRSTRSLSTPSRSQMPQLLQPEEPTQPRTPNLTGVWIKDKAASDSMEPTLQLMKVNRLIRAAVGLVKGMQIQQSDNSFELAVLSGILWFKITEQYPLDGQVMRYKRRDLRKGLHRGIAEKLPDGAVCITLEWDEPLGGVGTDVFYVPGPGLLYVDSTMLMHGQFNKYRTVYHKQ